MKYDHNRKNIILALKKLRDNVPDRRYGICYNASTSSLVDKSLLYRVIGHVAKKWHKFSGDLSYPVPCPNGGSPRRAWRVAIETNGDLWEGAYGRLRYELLLFIINYLESDIEFC